MLGHAATFDTYTYVQKLKAAGMDERHAAIQAEALFELIEERLTTKQDLTDTEAALQRDIKELDTSLQAKIEATKAELQRDIKGLDVKIEATKAELQRDIKGLDVKIEATKAELQRDIKELDTSLRAKIEATKAELQRDIKELDTKSETRLKELELRMVIKLGSMIIIGFGLMMTASRIWPVPVQYVVPPAQELRLPAPAVGQGGISTGAVPVAPGQSAP
ncbi:MAG: DUF1640 domain-containing protein [Magnetococcales bacterium]|nr:DUF1640 domain-containing protein [Magnetococcales bacterium]